MSGNKSKTTTTTKKTTKTSTKETTQDKDKTVKEKVVDPEETFVKTELNNIKDKIKKNKDIEETMEKFIELMPKYLNKKYQTQFYYALDMISFRVSKISNNQLVLRVYNEAKKCIDFMSRGHKKNLLDWIETMEKIIEGKYDSSERNDGRFDSIKKTTAKPKEKETNKNNENNTNDNNNSGRSFFERVNGEGDSSENEMINFGRRSILGNFSNQLNLMMLLNFFTGNRVEHQQYENRDFSLGEKDSFVPKFNPPNTFISKDYPFIKMDKLVFSSPKQVFSFKLDENTLSSVKQSGNLRICFFDVSSNSCIVPDVRKLDVNKEQLKNPFDKLFDHQKFFGLDISNYCNAGVNKIMIDFKQKNIEAQICLMKKMEVEDVIKDLKSIPKENTLNLIKKMFDTVDDEINILSSKFSFECPLSQNIINVPVRGSECAHVNCFDAFSFLTMNKTNPKFLCPVCDKKISSDSLRIDSYMSEIISTVSDLHGLIQFNVDGSYSVVDKKRSSEVEDEGGSSNKKRKIVLDLLDDD